MTKKDIFSTAHAITRATIQAGDDYRATFAAALRGLINGTLCAGRQGAAQNGKKFVEVQVGVVVGAAAFTLRWKKNVGMVAAAAFVVEGLGKEFDGFVRAYAA